MNMEVSSLLGGLIRLDQAERYHHRLNVFVLLAELLDLRRKAGSEDGEGGVRSIGGKSRFVRK